MDFLTALIQKYGLFAVFLNVLLEGMGLPIPSYPVLMIAAALVPQMHYTFAQIIGTGLVAAMIADSMWFWGGRHYGARIVKKLCRISLSPDSCVQNTNSMFTRIGPSSLTFAKFIPGFSSVSIVLASAMRISVPLVALFDTVGIVIYISTGVMLGSLFHNAIADTLKVLTTLGQGGVVLVATVFALFLFGKWIQRKRFMHQLRMNRITVDELRVLMDSGESPVILDVRPRELRRKEGIIPGSIIASDGDLKAVADSLPPDGEVVVYCSCPNEASAVMIAKKLQNAGFKKIRPLLGGIEAWTAAGHEIEDGTEHHFDRPSTLAA